MGPSEQTSNDEQVARYVFVEWDRRARSRDTAGLLDLYRNDAVLESPLVPRILDQESGVLRGRTAIGRFLAEGAARRPNELVRWWRSGSYLWDGHTLFWEYVRETPQGEQIDIAEVMELRDGLIARHRIYWGWFGTEQLIESALTKGF
jgi:ketosteroid isomerase-like protein